MNRSIDVYVICDNTRVDGKLYPLARHTYTTPQQAKQARDYYKFDDEYYPIEKMKLVFND